LKTLNQIQKNKFYKLGQMIYPCRWFIIALWFIAILACTPLLPHITKPFKTTGFIDENSKSAQAEEYINTHLKYCNDNKFLIIYHSDTLVATDPAFIKKIKFSLKNLNDFPIKHDIILPENNKKQMSKDKHTAYAVIIVKSQKAINGKLLTDFKSSIRPPKNMSVMIGGEPVFVDDVNHQTEKDLYNADFIATPVAIITLLLVFGSVIAAMVPILLGGGCALIILTTLYFLGHTLTLSIFTINIALLLGLCLSLDYALFIISRFRDELNDGATLKEAIAITQATAGKAIFYSGLAVFASLSALLLFPVNILFSVAIGGLSAVFIAVITAIIVLPAFLSVLSTRINFLTLPFFSRRKKPHAPTVWHYVAEKVVHRPLVFFFSILIVLLTLGYPFLSAKFGVADFHIFPEESKNRDFFDTYAEKFNENELSPIVILVKTKTPILNSKNISKLYDLTREINRNPAVKEINSIVTSNSSITKAQYHQLYNLPASQKPSEIKTLLTTTSGKYFTTIEVISKYPPNSTKTQHLIKDIEKLKLSKGFTIELTGTPVNNMDLLNSISSKLPHAMLWIMVFTYFILLFLLRSLFLPLKAILMNLLSLFACYGALVFVFQEGHLHQLLHFDPQGMLDISLLVIIFCALFGFSMDYEVFLLTRIKECHDESHDNQKSIVFGIEKSSRIITSAAIIVIFLCASFLVADVLMVKAFGLGIAVAIFVDAFLIRTILVPATMALVKEWNWYLPKWLDKILPNHHSSH
jgi:RND superfamily putative drug exporter